MYVVIGCGVVGVLVGSPTIWAAIIVIRWVAGINLLRLRIHPVSSPRPIRRPLCGTTT